MNNTLTLIIGLILTFIILSIARKIIFNIKSKGKFKNININDAVSIYKNNKNVGLIDVRSYAEVQQSGYIKNSINIALDDYKFEEKMSKLDKNKEYIVYCQAEAVQVWHLCVCINWVLQILIILLMQDIFSFQKL